MLSDQKSTAYTHELQIDLTETGAVTVATLKGNVDTVTAESLLVALQEAIASGRAQLVGDLSGVGYTSSAGLRALLGAMKQARQAGGDLRLAGVGDKVRKVLELSGFTSILRLYDDVETAVASFTA
jgi:anti-sigma B factor antagonist